jgi:hypothetical protein
VSVTDQQPTTTGNDSDELTAALDQVITRLHRESRRRYPRALVETLVRVCRTELSACPRHALPELVERLARERLRSGWASLLIEGQ